ncbi:hypothetical protein EVAR_9663_1 [Eumeta japonica]|uniref:CUB domain-containing protein n=1 Tax=Eumeta variegata TaxID=151549 RepID=A0A4C1TKZ4_EUMVA|nr:hypothetical protein EVAR_9663_1 [Eumeta japonica]
MLDRKYLILSSIANPSAGYEVLSTGPALLLQFTANSESPGQGFAATYHFQPPPDSTAADSDRLLKISFGKAFESLGPEVSATTALPGVHNYSRRSMADPAFESGGHTIMVQIGPAPIRLQ